VREKGRERERENEREVIQDLLQLRTIKNAEHEPSFSRSKFGLTMHILLLFKIMESGSNEILMSALKRATLNTSRPPASSGNKTSDADSLLFSRAFNISD